MNDLHRMGTSSCTLMVHSAYTRTTEVQLAFGAASGTFHYI
jgi:hypothetical protein